MSEQPHSVEDRWELHPGAPVVPSVSDDAFANRDRRADCDHLPITRVGDAEWPLHHLVHADHSDSLKMVFDHVPPELRDPVKVYLYNVLNTPPQRRTVNMKATLPAAASVMHIFWSLQRLTTWMSTQELTFPQMTEKSWGAYAQEVALVSSGSFTFKRQQLILINRVWSQNADGWVPK